MNFDLLKCFSKFSMFSVGAPPAVNALVVVPYHEYVVFAAQHFNDFYCEVLVSEFVHMIYLNLCR